MPFSRPIVPVARAPMEALLVHLHTGVHLRAGPRRSLSADDRRIRFGTCKRSARELPDDLEILDGHVRRFLDSQRQYEDWSIEKAAIATRIDP